MEDKKIDRQFPVVRNREEAETLSCPYGTTTRIITGGEGGVANVHVVTVSDGAAHYHKGYNETYYVLSGCGKLTVDNKIYTLKKGSVAVIPKGHIHSVTADNGTQLEFIIFGTPAMSVNNPAFTPMSSDSPLNE